MLGVTDRNGLDQAEVGALARRQGPLRDPAPARPKGTKLQLWQDLDQFFSTAPARPGGPVDLASYPARLLQRMPQAIASVVVP